MSVSGKSTAFARYSPISAESLASFLRSSSTFLAVASVAAVVATRSVANAEKLVVESETFSTFEIRVLSVTLPSKAVDAVSDDSPTLSVSELVSFPASVTVSFAAVCDPATVDEAEILVEADVLADSDALELDEADSDADVLADSEAEVLTDTDALVEDDSEALVLTDTDADSLADTDSLSLND
ncbi:hypothetical protein [Streptococcus pseudopneumoniae]|uniref:hypothetical protein n=1 Tax=Streptococcus pseudopneumoniae TaxID=257758 RepID=UPI00066CC813